MQETHRLNMIILNSFNAYKSYGPDMVYWPKRAQQQHAEQINHQKIVDTQNMEYDVWRVKSANTDD